MIEPGIVPIGLWRPEGVDPTQPGVTPLPVADPSTAPKMPAAGYAAVGRKVLTYAAELQWDRPLLQVAGIPDRGRE